jgi:hypothetical protein
MEDGESPGLPMVNGSALDVENQHDDKAMVELWGRLCFHTWPTEPRRYLSQAKVQARGGSAGLAASVLGLKPPTLSPIWTGVQPVTDEQVHTLADALEVEPKDLLEPDPLQEVLDRLAHPLFKERLLDAASRSGLTEGSARDAVRSEYALAARDDSLTVADAKLLDAIKRVASGHATP